MTEANGASAPTKTEVKALLQKAEKGNTTVLPTLRAYMDLTPGYLGEDGGHGPRDAAGIGANDLAAGEKNLVLQETITRKCVALTQELAGPTPSPLERLLVERIVLCWLQLHYAEAIYTQIKDMSLQQAAFHQSRISKAQAATWRRSGPWRRCGAEVCQWCRSTSGDSRSM